MPSQRPTGPKQPPPPGARCTHPGDLEEMRPSPEGLRCPACNALIYGRRAAR